ncbi:MAG: hypothetical protein ACAH59_12740 [Pseudobdellovibrionaceae bacterium]
MLRWFRLFSIAFLLMGISRAQAKVFNFANVKLAAYLGGGFGPAQENTLLSKANSDSANTVTLNSEHSYRYSGEFGVIAGGSKVNLGFGLEVLRPRELTDSSGKNSSDTELYTVTSEISVLIPKVTLEVTLKSWPKSRLFLNGQAGWATLTARNSFTFTADGQTAYSGLEDFYEDLRGMAPMYGGAMGFEKVFSDSTTYVFHAGYRSLVFDEVQHNRDVTTFQGAVTKGDKALNTDGQNRSIDLSSYFIGFMFRFWIK